MVTFPPAPRLTILVVDDNPDLVSLFRRYLRGEPYRLVQATSGAYAIRLAQSLRPDAIILDVLLPTSDGWDVLRQICRRAELRGIPVLVCSVLPELALARELGVADFLAKPVKRATLLDALRRCRSSSAGQ